MLTLHEHPARKWKPKRLRLRLWLIAGRITHRTHLKLAARAPWARLLTRGLDHLSARPAST